MTPLQALQSSTINSAKELKRDHQLGQNKRGFIAEIIPEKRNPLENNAVHEELQFVMNNCKVLKIS
ncbi:Xaa-Pro dipeptidase, partial [Pseudoalteromonas sp. S4389]